MTSSSRILTKLSGNVSLIDSVLWSKYEDIRVISTEVMNDLVFFYHDYVVLCISQVLKAQYYLQPDEKYARSDLRVFGMLKVCTSIFHRMLLPYLWGTPEKMTIVNNAH